MPILNKENKENNTKMISYLNDIIEEKVEHPTTRLILAFIKIKKFIKKFIIHKINNIDRKILYNIYIKELNKLYIFKRDIPISSIIFIEDFKNSYYIRSMIDPVKLEFIDIYNNWINECIKYNNLKN